MGGTLRLIAAQYGTISDIEVVWTIIALCGFCFSIYNIRDAILDFNALGRLQNGRRAIAVLSIKMEITRAIIQFIFICIGIVAFTVEDTPEQLDRPVKLILFSALIRWGFVIASILITYQSYANFILRRWLIAGSREKKPEAMSPTKEQV